MKEEVSAILRKAGAMILDRPDFTVDAKEGHANYVTTIDCSVQAFLEKELTALVPEAVFIGEEKDNEVLSDGLTWIIDPVDGTTNLIHDYRWSAISAALCKDRTPVLAWIYQPYTDEMFFAEKGQGAFVNGSPMRVADTPFDRALVAFGTSPYQAELAALSMKTALTFLQNCGDIRRAGSAALDLAYLAAGRHDVFFELNLKPWDVAAGALLVTEAGGRFDMPYSETGVDFSRPATIFAANARIFDEARALFAECTRKEM